MSQLNFSSIPDHVKTAESILIILNGQSTFDQQLAAASLLLALQEQGRAVSLLAPDEVNNPTISGLDQIRTEIGHKNLVIGFDYVPEAVNNVSYHIDEESQRFYLTIKPKKGHEPLDKDSVELDYAGAEADLIFLFGVDALEDLKQLYYGYEDVYQAATLISFHDYRTPYTSLAIDLSQISSACEALLQLINKSELSLNSEIATNLLAGIQYETNNFVDPAADADTFEAVASLLRAGARRKAGVFSRAAAGLGEEDLEQKIEIGRDVRVKEAGEAKAEKEQVVIREDADFERQLSKQSTPTKLSSIKKRNGEPKKKVKPGKEVAKTQKAKSEDQPVRPSGLKK
jgi:nicotinic acid mononucleotide adenylyltransferase